MRQLEESLSRLEAPAPPQNLKDRCMNTIPSTIPAARKAALHKKARPFTLRRAAVAGALMFSLAAGVAFWSTRPSSNGAAQRGGSALFAQVLEASQRITFFHFKARFEVPQKGESQDWRRMEGWYDASKGFYQQDVRELLLRIQSDVKPLPPGASFYTRMLTLPDGTVYGRSEMASRVFVGMAPGNWKALQNQTTGILSGNVAGTKDFSGTYGQVLSSTEGHWKGQKAQILVLERQPSPQDAARGRGPVQARFYVNPDTKLVIAWQDFATSQNGSPQLVGEYEFDYSRPDPALFDPKGIKAGAEVRIMKHRQPSP